MGFLKFLDILVTLGNRYPFAVTLRPPPWWTDWLTAEVTLADPLHQRAFLEDATFEGLLVTPLLTTIQLQVPDGRG